MQKKGWDLLFYVNVISIIYTIINIILSPASIVSGIISVIIGLYVLFEVREHFQAGTQSAEATK